MPGLPKSIIKKYGVTKKAWAVFRGRHRRSGSARTVKHRSVRTRMRRRYGRRHRGGGKSLVRGIERLAKTAALIGPTAYDVYNHRDHPIEQLVYRLSGYSAPEGRWHPEALVLTYGPYVGTTAAFKIAGKINGLIRRL